MSKVSRSVQAGFANGERKLKQRWERAKAAKGQDRMGLNRSTRGQIKYEAGSSARSQGKMIWHNPYPTTNPKSGWEDWESGWLDRDVAITNGDR